MKSFDKLHAFYRNQVKAPAIWESVEGIRIYTTNNDVYLDATAGKGATILGARPSAVMRAVQSQMNEHGSFVNMSHFRSKESEEVANSILQNCGGAFRRVYFAGQSGSEALEAALRISMQTQRVSHRKLDADQFLFRQGSYHGSTEALLQISDMPTWRNLRNSNFNIRRLPTFWPSLERQESETVDEYVERLLVESEEKILQIGPEKISGWVLETVSGVLIGAQKSPMEYWTGVRKLCDKYAIDLILDEVYCGFGRTGKFIACPPELKPEMLVLGKSLGAGVFPTSAVLINQRIENDLISEHEGVIHYGHTALGHPLGLTATSASISEVVPMMPSIIDKGTYLRKALEDAIEGIEGIAVRNEGLMVALEFSAERSGNSVAKTIQYAFQNENLILKGGLRHIALSPPYNTSYDDLDEISFRLEPTLKHLDL